MSEDNAAAKKEAIINAIRDWSEQQSLVLSILFGSQATGKTHTLSDVDLAIWPRQMLLPADMLRWAGELQDLLKCEISLVIVSPRLDPVLGMEIVRHGLVIYEAAAETWFEKRLDLWHAYNDAQPFLRAQFADVGKLARELANGA